MQNFSSVGNKEEIKFLFHQINFGERTANGILEMQTTRRS